MKILIADNYPLSRHGVVQILRSKHDNYHLAEAINEEEVYDLLKREKFDLVILGFSHPGKNSMGILKHIKEINSSIPVLILCIYPEQLYGLRALRIGASGYISRESNASELLGAVESLLAGDVYSSPELARNLQSKISRKRKQSHELLSNRELQVLQLMASGKTAKKISAETALSVNTISTYRSRILTKLKFKTNAELTRFAIENALV